MGLLFSACETRMMGFAEEKTLRVTFLYFKQYLGVLQKRKA
jgi:hypothetical protein